MTPTTLDRPNPQSPAVDQEQLLDLLRRKFTTISHDQLEELAGLWRWRLLAGGEVLYRTGDAADRLHLLVSGRLQARVTAAEGKTRAVGDIGAGEFLGEMGLLSGEARQATVVALRDSVLVELSDRHFELFCRRHPEFLRLISQTVIDRLRRGNEGGPLPARTRTLALLPVSPLVDIQEFLRRWLPHLNDHGRVGLIDHRVAEKVQVDALDNHRDRVLAHWLNQQEADHDLLLLQAEARVTDWTLRCLRQADQVLLVGNFYDSTEERPLEEDLRRAGYSLPENTELALLHPDGDRPPIHTAGHLQGRQLRQHHHIRLDREGDLGRLARFVRGRAVGLVFGGGGARGFAHLGVVQAWREAGRPIDAIGGTSMGAVIGGLVAQDLPEVETLAQAHQGFVLDKPVRGFTLPLISIYNDRRLDRALQKGYGDRHIEDLWLPFYCVSSNLSTAREHVHRQGPVWKAVRASLSIPGVFPPVVYGNHLHVDGGLINNLPVDVMREQGLGTVVAVDLKEELNYELSYTKMPSAWQLLRWRWLGFKKNIRVPSLPVILTKSAVLHSQDKSDRLCRLADFVFRPPVGGYGLLDMARFDEIREVGYRHAREQLTTY